MSDKRVGVFTQLFRNEPSMHKAIRSVLEQTYENFRYYILVSDKTEAIVQEYAKNDVRVIVWKKDTQKDFNYYIKEVAEDGNEYVMVVDGDDWCTEDYIAELLAYAEKYQTEITACGNYFVDGRSRVIEERKVPGLVWETRDTDQVLPYMYAFYRTIWGKLIKADVIKNYDVTTLISNESCGGYGTDTTFMFNLLCKTKRLGICDKSLYYYRISETGGSYVLKPGREESDELLFIYVSDVLKSISRFEESEKRFLFHVYGMAVRDTVNLIKNTKLNGTEQAKKIRYVMEKGLTKELLFREAQGNLWLPQMQNNVSYRNLLYSLIFGKPEVCCATETTTAEYLKIFEALNPNKRDVLNVAEFSLLLRRKELLDLFEREQYERLFECLFAELRECRYSKLEACLKLMRRLTKEATVKSILIEKKFVLTYEEIIKNINNQNKEEAFQQLQDCFSGSELPYGAECLIELWINLAAEQENAELFLLGKQLQVELLFTMGKKEEAKERYMELIEMGIKGENMEYLRDCLGL